MEVMHGCSSPLPDGLSDAFRVANRLGHGFVEKVYEIALIHEMRKCGLSVVQQQGNVVLTTT